MEQDPHVHLSMKTNNAISKTPADANISVSLAHSRYGTAQPQVEIRYPRGTHYRVVRAALYALAAKLETATPAGDNWVVEVDAFGDESGRVYLELVKADDVETKRGLALLRKVVG